MDKNLKSSKQTESWDKLSRARPSEHAGLKRRLINVDAMPVLIRSALKQHFF